MNAVPSLPPAPESARERVDKWLWTVRIYKTRGLATEACRAGSVTVGNDPVKPSHDVRPGEVVSVRQGLISRTLVVRAIPFRRIGPKLVADFCEDRTSPEEYEKLRAQPVQQFLARDKGAGRPTKRDRRALEKLLDL